eukprot:scaffold123105_cov30-Tisochrysis_lutea.AAC.12
MRQNRQRYFAAARDGANVSVEGQRIIINAERALSDATKAAEVSRRLKVIRDVQLSDLEREVRLRPPPCTRKKLFEKSCVIFHLASQSSGRCWHTI